jgi:hypothetical protein
MGELKDACARRDLRRDYFGIVGDWRTFPAEARCFLFLVTQITSVVVEREEVKSKVLHLLDYGRVRESKQVLWRHLTEHKPDRSSIPIVCEEYKIRNRTENPSNYTHILVEVEGDLGVFHPQHRVVELSTTKRCQSSAFRNPCT